MVDSNIFELYNSNGSGTAAAGGKDGIVCLF